MFTGIIEGLGTITKIRSTGQGKRLVVTADFPLHQTKIGDSIAVCGACLTAVVINKQYFEVDVAPETLKRSILGYAKSGDRVNIERALRLSDRIDGHLVSGHIDGTGEIKSIETQSNAIIISICVPENLAHYMIHKGSVAVDGVSLTINKCDHSGFEVSIIPHTAKLTTIGFKNIGDSVNIETDMIGKYVERFITQKVQNNSGEKQEKQQLNMEFLAKTGFL